jgi:hypothetical protein
MGQRQIGFIYNLLDKNNNFKKRLTGVKGCNITYSSLSTLKYNANLTMNNDASIDWLNDRIQVICRIDGIDYPLGIYIITSPNLNKNEDILSREVTMYSPIVLLERDKVQERYYLPIGTDIIAEIKRLIGANPYNIEDGTYTTISAKEYEIGTPKITIINELLDSINYTSLYMDMSGTMRAKKYILPSDRQIEISYLDGRNSILHKEVTEVKDLFDVPNVFIRYTNNADITPPLVARYENNNADSETSTVNAPINVDAQEVTDVTDLQTLQDITKRDAYNASQIYSNLQFETAINPVHDYMNCVYVKYGDIDYKYIETSWSIDCAVGGKMQHTARRVITV